MTDWKKEEEEDENSDGSREVLSFPSFPSFPFFLTYGDGSKVPFFIPRSTAGSPSLLWSLDRPINFGS